MKPFRLGRARLMVAGVATLALLAVGTGVAFAQGGARTSGYVYRNTSDGGICTYINTHIDDTYTRDQPEMDTYGSVDQTVTVAGTSSPSPCYNTSYRILAGSLAVQQQLAIWNGSTWVICNTNAPWVYNAPPSSHDVRTGFTWVHPPCGQGWYEDNAAAFADDGTGWKGKWTYTNYIWVEG